MAAGERVIRVPPALTGESREGDAEPGSPIRSTRRAVALAAIREGVEASRSAFLDEQAHEIRVLCDYRDQIIAERVRTDQPVALAPGADRARSRSELRPRGAEGPTRSARGWPASSDGCRDSPSCGSRRRCCGGSTRSPEERRTARRAHRPDRQAHARSCSDQPGCGTVTAAIIIGQTAGAQRFRTDAAFARHTGTAPIPASSGKTIRHRLHRGGDRQLNRAIHIIALVPRPHGTPKPAPTSTAAPEGKTKREALRCLKRHIARQIWHILYTTQPPPSCRRHHGPIIAAPALMPCTARNPQIASIP